MSRARQRADRIRSEINIVRVLADYGYNVHIDGGDREQQFPCDLHGDGLDNKPSARVYPESDSWYCWACGRSRDAIQTVREKEGLSFWEAIKLLETRYGLPALPWSDDEPREVNPEEEVRDTLDYHRTWEDDKKRLHTLLETITEDRDLSMDTLLGLWEAYDRIRFMVDAKHAVWEEKQGKVALEKLRQRIMQRLAEAAQ